MQPYDPMRPNDPMRHETASPVHPIDGQQAPTVVYYPAPRRSILGRILLVVFLLCGFCVFLTFASALLSAFATIASESGSRIQEEHYALSKTGKNKIAVLTLDGTIMDGESGFLKAQIDRVRNDDAVKALILRVNSPGGTISGSDYLYHHLRTLIDDRQLPMVVSMGSVAASGGYYVAMAAGPEENIIFAEPTTWTGSIGVVIPHYSVAGLMDQLKIEEESIKSHRLKQMGSPFTQLTDEERGILQGLVDEGFDRFKEVVQYGRPEFAEDPKKLDKVATGQIFTTKQAIELGLVDQEGFVEEAIDRALTLANLDRDTTKVVRFKQPLGLFGLALNASARSSAPSTIDSLFELATPRAYYLHTALPIALRQGK